MFNDFNGLVITQLRIVLWNQPGSRLKAFADFTLNNAVVVSGIRIVNMSNGRILVAFPDREKADGSFASQAFPCSTQARQWIENAVLREYCKELARTAPKLQAAS